MGYYTIELSPESSDLTTSVSEFVKFRYNRVPKGLCNSSDIFQDKVDKLIGYIREYKAYINNILVLGKGGFSQRIEHLRVIFASLRDSGIIFNAPNCSFELK